MRELNRRMVAEAKSHRASSEELRAAKQRIKEIEAELRQIELANQTKHGEDREQRYERIVRLREMREDFLATVNAAEPPHLNSLLLALVMFVCSFLLCGFCAFSGYFALTLANQTPDPTTTGSTFWSAVEQQQYNTVEGVLFSPTLRAKIPLDTLVSMAAAADTQFGTVSSATLYKQGGDGKQNASLTYVVTRVTPKGKKTVYQAVLQMELFSRNWVINDAGAALSPTLAGAIAPTATAGPSPTPLPTEAPTPTLAPTATNTPSH